MLLCLFCLLHVCCCSGSSSSHFWGAIFVFFFLISGIQSKIRGIYLVLHSLCACFVFFTRGYFLVFSGFVVCERASLVLCYSSSIHGFCVDSVVLYDFLPSYCSPGRGGLGENTYLLERHHLDSVYTVLHLLLAKHTFCECSLAWYLFSGHHCTFSSCYWKATQGVALMRLVVSHHCLVICK